MLVAGEFPDVIGDFKHARYPYKPRCGINMAAWKPCKSDDPTKFVATKSFIFVVGPVKNIKTAYLEPLNWIAEPTLDFDIGLRTVNIDYSRVVFGANTHANYTREDTVVQWRRLLAWLSPRDPECGGASPRWFAVQIHGGYDSETQVMDQIRRVTQKEAKYTSLHTTKLVVHLDASTSHRSHDAMHAREQSRRYRRRRARTKWNNNGDATS